MTRPCAVWDVGTGAVYVDRQLAAGSWGREEVTFLVGALGGELMQRLAAAAAQVRDGESGGD